MFYRKLCNDFIQEILVMIQVTLDSYVAYPELFFTTENTSCDSYATFSEPSVTIRNIALLRSQCSDLCVISENLLHTIKYVHVLQETGRSPGRWASR